MKKIVLIIDDDDITHMEVSRALGREEMDLLILSAYDGEDAIELLKKSLGSGEHNLPEIVFLDLNMPRMNGLEFLKAVRKIDELKHLIIFILSTSDHPDDIAQAKKHNIAGYLVKSQQGRRFEKFTELVRSYFDSTHSIHHH